MVKYLNEIRGLYHSEIWDRINVCLSMYTRCTEMLHQKIKITLHLCFYSLRQGPNQNYFTFVHKLDVTCILCTGIQIPHGFSQNNTQVSWSVTKSIQNVYFYFIQIWVYVFIKHAQSVQKALQRGLFTQMSNQPVSCLPQNHSSLPLKIQKIHPSRQSHFGLIDLSLSPPPQM